MYQRTIITVVLFPSLLYLCFNLTALNFTSHSYVCVLLNNDIVNIFNLCLDTQITGKKRYNMFSTQQTVAFEITVI